MRSCVGSGATPPCIHLARACYSWTTPKCKHGRRNAGVFPKFPERPLNIAPVAPQRRCAVAPSPVEGARCSAVSGRPLLVDFQMMYWGGRPMPPPGATVVDIESDECCTCEPLVGRKWDAGLAKPAYVQLSDAAWQDFNNEMVCRTGLEPQPSRLKIDLQLTRASPALDSCAR